MNYENILKEDERVIFAIRRLYLNSGYRHFKMGKFLEYDFYSKNKSELTGDGVISFTDTDGKLLALKPDVTLSIIKNYKSDEGTKKYFYNENVYRISKSTGAYREIMQTGVELMGNVGKGEIFSTLALAAESLKLISDDFCLAISSLDLICSLLGQYNKTGKEKEDILRAITEKNDGKLKSKLTEAEYAVFSELIKINPSFEKIEKALSEKSAKDALTLLKEACEYLKGLGYGDKIYIDLSLNFDGTYYNGIVFRGFISSVSSAVISGGQYDRLMKKLDRDASAIGFAVYLDELSYKKDTLAEKCDYVNVALPKGRLGEKVYSAFEAAGLGAPDIRENTRKLVYENRENKMRFFWVKPSDVAIYVERGAADIGVIGKDILLEYSPDLYELLDLGEGVCRMAVAAKTDFVDDESRTLRVATKFSNIAKHFYNEKSRDIEIIHLNGSIELAPLLGLSDVIVDIVETGKTLLENGLVPIETITNISARLVSNKASYSFKSEKIEKIKSLLSKGVGNKK